MLFGGNNVQSDNMNNRQDLSRRSTLTARLAGLASLARCLLPDLHGPARLRPGRKAVPPPLADCPRFIR
jgi:hypothetical protein